MKVIDGLYVHRLNKTIHNLVQVMHGGVFQDDNVTLDDLRKIYGNRQPPESAKYRTKR